MVSRGDMVKRMVAVTEGAHREGGSSADDREFLILVYEANDTGLELRKSITASLPGQVSYAVADL